MSNEKRKLESLLTDLRDDNYREFLKQTENPAAAKDKNDKSVDSLLGGEEKARIYNKTTEAICRSVQAKPRGYHRRSPLLYTRTVPLLVVCILLLSATVATGSGSLQIHDKLAELLQVSNTDSANLQAMPVEEEKSDSEVEIQNAQAVGDGKSIYVAYDLTVPEDIALDESYNLAEVNIIIDGKSGDWASCYKLADCRENHATVLMNIVFDDETCGKDIVIENKGIGKYTYNGEEDLEYEPLYSGSWTVSCHVQKDSDLSVCENGKKGPKTFAIGGIISAENGDITLKSVKLSPFSADFNFDCDEIPFSVLDSVALVLKDGSTFSSADGNMAYAKGGQAVMSFYQMIDPADVEAVKLGDSYYYLDN